MNRARSLAIVPFAWAMIGADGGGCNPWSGWSNPPPPPPPSPSKPYCNADPPVGCAAVCVAEDDVELTSACADVGASTRAADFAEDVQNAIDTIHTKGLTSCSASQVGLASITPCQDGLAPAEWPNQDHESCTPPPVVCIVGSR